MSETTPAPSPAELTAKLTLEEKASLTSGADFWRTQAIDRLGIPAIMMSDGPHGLRKQATGGDHLGLGGSVPATCFPPAVGLGSSWNIDLAHRVGQALGTEASIENVSVLLSPGVTLKRSPLCGRNFEYVSEDPIVSAEIGAAIINGIQSMGVGSSLKHFAANNREQDRMRASSDIDPRPLRELYLRAFERIVADADPWTIMASYNRLNGTFVSQNPWLLTEVLRDDWGYDGIVVSDWGAVNDRVAGLPAGLDLEMPSSEGRTNAQIVAAVESGEIPEKYLDLTVTRILELVQKARAGAGRAEGPLDVDAHHELAREAARHSIVLLRNECSLLPLKKNSNLAVIGEFAEKPRYQGAGSSLISVTRLDNALDELRALSTGSIEYRQGFSTDPDVTSDAAAALRAEAVSAAKQAETAVVFLGLADSVESEGYDREDINLPAAQLELLDAVLEANPNTVVVLSNGSVVALPFRDRAPAIVEGWLLGQGGGKATADVLFGEVNPSGKLTETIPLRLSDTPSYLDFGGDFLNVRYGEGIYVGYRWYDARDMEVAYPFGHGLSYTSYEYGDATPAVTADGDVSVRLTISNTGAAAGREVVQVYTGRSDSLVQRPVRELKGFASVTLEPGESREIEIVLRRQDLAYWDVRVDRWVVEGGEYTIDVAASSRDIRTTTTLTVEGDELLLPLTPTSSIAEVLADPVAGPMLSEALSGAGGSGAMQQLSAVTKDAEKMLGSSPIGRLSMLVGDALSDERVNEILTAANAKH